MGPKSKAQQHREKVTIKAIQFIGMWLTGLFSNLSNILSLGPITAALGLSLYTLQTTFPIIDLALGGFFQAYHLGASLYRIIAHKKGLSFFLTKVLPSQINSSLSNLATLGAVLYFSGWTSIGTLLSITAFGVSALVSLLECTHAARKYNRLDPLDTTKATSKQKAYGKIWFHFAMGLTASALCLITALAAFVGLPGVLIPGIMVASLVTLRIAARCFKPVGSRAATPPPPKDEEQSGPTAAPGSFNQAWIGQFIDVACLRYPTQDPKTEATLFYESQSEKPRSTSPRRSRGP